MKLLYFLFISLYIHNISYADILQNKLDDLNCPITPQMIELKQRPPIYETNNLRRKSGTPNLASGDLIIIRGQLLDSDCVPIPDAIIEIWQADALGNDVLSPNFDNNFIGGGKTITDNMGNYVFFSVMPGSTSEFSAPHINFMIRHRDFLPFETRMYFENQNINDVDKMLNKYVSASQKHLLISKTTSLSDTFTDDIEYKFNVTLEGINKYLRY